MFLIKWIAILGFIFVLFCAIFSMANAFSAYGALIWPTVWITTAAYLLWPWIRRKGD